MLKSCANPWPFAAVCSAIIAAVAIAPEALQAQSLLRVDRGVDSGVVSVDAGVNLHDGISSSEDPRDEHIATHVLGSAEQDRPDPTGDEGEITGSAEGEPLPAAPQAALEIASLSDRQCIAAVRRAGISWAPSGRVQRGISQPIFVNGPIGGVTYRASGSRVIHELMDCRLAVALLRWSRQLRTLSIREVVHLSIYRPATESAVQRQPIQTRHPGAMAIDAGVFVRDDGSTLSVLEHFRGALGHPVCGPEARVPRDERARVLRTIACDSARRGLFHVVLTPNFNEPHRNHLHLEVTRGVSWQYVR